MTRFLASLAARFLARRKSTDRALIRRRTAQIRVELGLAQHPALKGN